jgi:hypothetical protein
MDPLCPLCDTSVLDTHAQASYPCQHKAHLVCALEQRRHICPTCHVVDARTNLVDLGLGNSNVHVAQLLLKSIEREGSGSSAWGRLFKRRVKFSTLLQDHPEALLATHHPLDFVQGKARLADVVGTYDLKTLTAHGFLLAHLDALSPNKAQTLAILYKKYGMADTNAAWGVDGAEIKDRCRTLTDLLALGLSVEESCAAGVFVGDYLRRGATLNELVHIPLYRDMPSEDSSFAEFSMAWGQLTNLELKHIGCQNEDLVDHLTMWDFSSIPVETEVAAPVSGAPLRAPLRAPLKAGAPAGGLNFNF